MGGPTLSRSYLLETGHDEGSFRTWSPRRQPQARCPPITFSGETIRYRSGKAWRHYPEELREYRFRQVHLMLS